MPQFSAGNPPRSVLNEGSLPRRQFQDRMVAGCCEFVGFYFFAFRTRANRSDQKQRRRLEVSCQKEPSLPRPPAPKI